MGTNFYIFTQDKQAVRNFFTEADQILIVDEPDFGYLIHIAKTSCGWLPLFQGYSGIRSVTDIKKVYDAMPCRILDEYGNEYDWESFDKHVLQFSADSDAPISHLRFNESGMFWIDQDGYEFMKGKFY